jgi:hypothetical protein
MEGQTQRLLVNIRTLFMDFYKNTMKWDRFQRALKFLHFNNIKNYPDKTDENYDPLWTMRIIADKLNYV